MDFNLIFYLYFPKIYVNCHDEHSFDDKFREKSLPESSVTRRFVLGRLKAVNPLKLMRKVMKQIKMVE